MFLSSLCSSGLIRSNKESANRKEFRNFVIIEMKSYSSRLGKSVAEVGVRG